MMSEIVAEDQPVLTIGHGTRPIGDFLAILESYGVTLVADVRTMPRSRHNPQYNIDILPASLAGRGIAYYHASGLGGLRKALRDSPNTGWRNASFRGFADYMQTPEFDASLSDLMERISGQKAALMCAETLPWRCHRSLIADALLMRNIRVLHIFGEGKATVHTITPWARTEGTRIVYPDSGLLPAG